MTTHAPVLAFFPHPASLPALPWSLLSIFVPLLNLVSPTFSGRHLGAQGGIGNFTSHFHSRIIFPRVISIVQLT